MRALGIFAQAPIPGRVKTRLAEDVGPSTAAELYWQVGRRVVTNVAGSGYRTIVWFTPLTEGARRAAAASASGRRRRLPGTSRTARSAP